MKRLNLPPVTLGTVIVCTVIFILSLFSGMENAAESAILCGAYYKPFIMCGEYWRFLTAGLVHVSFLHLAVNMFSLTSMGSFMELKMGHLKYAVILFGSVIGGSLFTFCTEGNTVTIGLSGGLYGLLAGYSVIVFSMDLAKIPVIRTSLIRTYVICILMNFMPAISVTGHIGGYIAGLFLTALLSEETKKKFKSIHFRIAAVLYAAVLCIFTYRGWRIPAEQIYMRSDYNILKRECEIGLKSHAVRMAERLDVLYDSEDTLSWLIREDN